MKQIVYGLKANHQSTLHRHLSNESHREQADMRAILNQHGDDSFEGDEVNLDDVNRAIGGRCSD